MKLFIDMAVSQLGISVESATNAAGGVLGLIKDNASEGDFQQLADAVPGLGDVLSAGSGGGGLGGLMGAASGMLGGKAGAAVGLMGVMKSAGLSADQVGQFVPMLFQFLQSKAGAGVVSSVLGQIPELKKLVG